MFNTIAALCLIMCSTKNNLQAILYLNAEKTEDEKDFGKQLWPLCTHENHGSPKRTSVLADIHPPLSWQKRNKRSAKDSP